MYNSKHDILSDAETNELLLQAQQGNEIATEKLVESHVRLVTFTARRYFHPGYETDDFIQLGMVGLLKAIRDYSFEKKVKFSTYVVTKVSGEIQTWLRDHSHVIRIPRDVSITMRKIHSQDLLYSTVEEIAAKLDMDDIECIKEALNLIANPLMYIDIDVVEEENTQKKMKIIDVLAGDANSEWLSDMSFDSIISCLDERERTIMDLKYRHGLVSREIAPIFGITGVQISRLVRKSLVTLREQFEKEKIVHS